MAFDSTVLHWAVVEHTCTDIVYVSLQADVLRKINRAFCPIGVIEKNPCINWARHSVCGKYASMTIERAEADGGTM